MHSGTPNLEPVQEEEEALRESLMEEVDVGDATPVPRVRSPREAGHPMFDLETGIILFYLGPYFFNRWLL